MNPLTAPRFQTLLTTLRQPQWIAALLSVGVHGVLFAAGPSFSSLNMTALGGSEPSLEERRVPLIELTPEEQGRLPDFSASAYSLFPEGDDDLYSLFPPSGNSLPLNPPAGQSPPRGSFNPFPSLIAPGGRSTFVLPSRRATLPPIPSSGGQRRPQAANRPAGDGSPASTPTTGQAPSAQEPSADDLAARPDRPTGGEGDPAANPPSPGAGDRANDLLARVEYSDAQTTSAEVETAKAAWVQAVKEKLGDEVVEYPEPITLEVPYTGRICLSPEPAEGLLGLVGTPADPDSPLWTTVLKSTGYPFLNEAAEQNLKALLLQPEEEGLALESNTLYQVVVEVSYDSETCITREALLQSRGEAAGDGAAPAAPEAPASEAPEVEAPGS
jgi:hypothetical protein